MSAGPEWARAAARIPGTSCGRSTRQAFRPNASCFREIDRRQFRRDLRIAEKHHLRPADHAPRVVFGTTILMGSAYFAQVMSSPRLIASSPRRSLSLNGR